MLAASQRSVLLWVAFALRISIALLFLTYLSNKSDADASPTLDSSPLTTESFRLSLSPEESLWLESHPVIRVSMDSGWPPFSTLLDDSHFVGIDSMILKELEAIVGIRFEPVTFKSWSEIESALRNREVDAVTGIAYLPSRSDYATFTKPYLSFPVAVIMRENSPFFIRMAALKNKTATLPRDYVTTAFVESTLPSVQVLYVDSSAEALGMVSSGKSDFTVENLASASYIIRRNGFSNLKIAALTSVSFDHRIAVRDDWPILASILDKALHAIPESSKAAILEEWLPVEVDTTINWPYIFRIAGAIFLACVLILVVSLAWNRRIANELEERRKIEAELREKTERLDALSTDVPPKKVGLDSL